jgi:phosphonate transport system ATP-binding protein
MTPVSENNLETKTAAGIALEVRGLALKRGGRTLFREMSWRLPAGNFLAVTGASGIGKSSLLAALGGMLAPDEGEIVFAEKARVGFVFQNFRLTPNLSVLQNVLCGKLGAHPWWRTLFGFPEGERQAAYHLLVELGLENYVHRPARETSGGEQQRTALARTLLQSPEIVLADEPISNLDANLARRVMSLLRREAKDAARTIVCVLHDARYVEEFADYELRLDAEQPDGWSYRKLPR